MTRLLNIFIALLFTATAFATERYNFNADWLLHIGDNKEASGIRTDDSIWQSITLPYAWNQNEAFSRNCAELSDSIVWYRKHFRLSKSWRGKRILIEFEGVRFAADIYLNGKKVGKHDNGVMAFGFDLTPFIDYSHENVIAVRVDNSWTYRQLPEEDINGTKNNGTPFQWNDRNFYCNYGGINKNVWLHVANETYQTLPLYSNLKTTGIYVYADSIKLSNKADTTYSISLHCETQVVNSSRKRQNIQHHVIIKNLNGNTIADINGENCIIMPGDTIKLKTASLVDGINLWSWGYGVLYDVISNIIVDGKITDSQTIRTGFRKTDFKDGIFYLNNRALQLKGFAQRSTNEWPAVGISVPAWMSDYSNRLMLECNANIIRWMHVTPSKQDIISCDRLGLMMAMPAGDSEKDASGQQWRQRCELMRDAIIYNRNNPSIIFYEGGNNQISEDHMAELLNIRNTYDPHGGRAIGSRNMLDSKTAEYGGEMLYVNKSATKPMWQMEYNRDEGIRRYWDRWSYPYHEEGDGPLYRGERAIAYNHNQDGLAIENIVRWNEYWKARPGMGKRVNAGGVKIIFSDSNTHARGEKNYRTSGVVDAMRLPKDSYYALQAMWDGWVNTEHHHTRIIGHWNYEDYTRDHILDTIAIFRKPVYVVSTADEVRLSLQPIDSDCAIDLGKGIKTDGFLHTFNDVEWQKGTLKAVGYKDGKEVDSHTICTVDEPIALRMHWIENTDSMMADGADIRICEVEAIDKNGLRHPLCHDMLHFTLHGEGEYLGGISGIVSHEEQERNRRDAARGEYIKEGRSTDRNAIGSNVLHLEAGVCRVMVRSTNHAGNVRLEVEAYHEDNNDSITSTTPWQRAMIEIDSKDVMTLNGFYTDTAGKPIEHDMNMRQSIYTKRGATPLASSYKDIYRTVEIKGFEVAVNPDLACLMADDNEVSGWNSDGNLQNSWIKINLKEKAKISMITLRMKGFRTTSYPIQVLAGDRILWQGYTPKTLGDCYLPIEEPIESDTYIIRMMGSSTTKSLTKDMQELAETQNMNSGKTSKSNVLSIIEISMNEKITE